MAIVVRNHSDQSHSVPHRQRRVVSGEHDRTSFRPFVRRHRSGNACVGFVLGNLAEANAWSAYAAIEAAETAIWNAAEAAARATYDQAMAAADAAWDAAEASAWAGYTAAMDTAVVNWDTAAEDAWTAYETAMSAADAAWALAEAAAWAAYETAVAAAETAWDNAEAAAWAQFETALSDAEADWIAAEAAAWAAYSVSQTSLGIGSTSSDGSEPRVLQSAGGLDNDQFHHWFHFVYKNHDVWIEFNGRNTSRDNPGGYVTGADGYVTITTTTPGTKQDPLDIPGTQEDAERLLEWLNKNTKGDVRAAIDAQIAKLSDNPASPGPTDLDGQKELATYGLIGHDCRSFARTAAEIYTNKPSTVLGAAQEAAAIHQSVTGEHRAGGFRP